MQRSDVASFFLCFAPTMRVRVFLRASFVSLVAHRRARSVGRKCERSMLLMHASLSTSSNVTHLVRQFRSSGSFCRVRLVLELRRAARGCRTLPRRRCLFFFSCCCCTNALYAHTLYLSLAFSSCTRMHTHAAGRACKFFALARETHHSHTRTFTHTHTRHRSVRARRKQNT